MTNAAIAAADAASLAAYQRQLDATAIWMRDHRDRGEPPKMICDAVPAGFDHDEQILCVLPGVDLMELRGFGTRSGAVAVPMAARPSDSLAGSQFDSAPAAALATA